MTLTRFFTKYVYIPLGGSRKGIIRRYVNILIVFLVSGIWHGANWTYILWGVINGIGNVLEKIFGRFFRWVPRAIGVTITFVFCLFSMSLFRAESITQARQLWRHLKVTGDGVLYKPMTDAFNDLVEVKLLCKIGLDGIVRQYPGILLVAFSLIVLAACFLMKNTQEKIAQMRYSVSQIIVIIVLMLWSILTLSDVSEFLYFNF